MGLNSNTSSGSVNTPIRPAAAVFGLMGEPPVEIETIYLRYQEWTWILMPGSTETQLIFAVHSDFVDDYVSHDICWLADMLKTGATLYHNDIPYQLIDNKLSVTHRHIALSMTAECRRDGSVIIGEYGTAEQLPMARVRWTLPDGEVHEMSTGEFTNMVESILSGAVKQSR